MTPVTPRHVLASLFVVLAVLSCPAADAAASGGIDPADPMVRITYPKSGLDVPAVLAAVSREVSKATGLGEEFVTYYWQTFDAVHAMGQPAKDKPLFVDLYVPGFFTDEQVGAMMSALADSLSKNTGLDKKWVFVHTHFPLQGQVYISGEVSRWDNYRGKPEKPLRDMADRAMGRFLFNDGAFVFQCLWRAGLIAAGGADLGEMLTITSQVKDYDKESWYQAWNAMARRVRDAADRDAAAGHAVSAMQQYFRATEYFRASSIYLFGSDPRGATAWQDGRDTFLKAAQLSEGRIRPVRIPYEKTTLPGYLVTPDNTNRKRPLLLIQTGLDGTAEDLYFILAAHAVKRGYACLIYEGPGQGEMIVKQNLPFRSDWEKVVTPVVDFAMTLPGVDPRRMAIIGYSMGGYLVPRALAFEKRIQWGIADGGVVSPFEGVMTKFPAEVQKGVDVPAQAARVDEIVAQEMARHPELNQFISQMLWTFEAKTPSALFSKLKRFNQADTMGKIETEMLVVNSSEDQVAASNAQSKLFFNGVKAKKTYMEFDASRGTQFHCQLGAPLASSERILDWLDERARPRQ
ncbi:2,6-dihydropseudooxynicotine hydrolase [Fundidesulfovibrio magnetotacticus]|uniref:2,6-dihydropseudooxynicotine hydrolase n=1 Tax=Fundidesulfovibrio magnetotacticus TaxID=2730080 RepID=A0A6V8LVP4_9BACT|nr:alpha/beta hydrolase [Fundidesulfovibrio magnetotacticus]GFK95814.1 2,6-dihydropseudooxynicotine hydrolase [Fundidesulfovibrio magnetotacticus]